MFIPFLAAAAVATTFAALGAMSVKIAVLTLALKAVSIAFLAAALSAIAIFIRPRRGAMNWVSPHSHSKNGVIEVCPVGVST